MSNLSGREGNLIQVSLLGEGFVLFARSFMLHPDALLLKKYGNQYDVVTLSGYQFMSGGLILILIGLFGGGRVRLAGFTYILLLYLAFMHLSGCLYTLGCIVKNITPCKPRDRVGFIDGGVLCPPWYWGRQPRHFP